MQQVMEAGPPFPVVLRGSSEYTVHDDRRKSILGQPLFEVLRTEALSYRTLFQGVPHWNYHSNSEDSGPVVVSIKLENASFEAEGQPEFQVIVRTQQRTTRGSVPLTDLALFRADPVAIVKVR